jgi:hypothetical protein
MKSRVIRINTKKVLLRLIDTLSACIKVLHCLMPIFFFSCIFQFPPLFYLLYFASRTCTMSQLYWKCGFLKIWIFVIQWMYNSCRGRTFWQIPFFGVVSYSEISKPISLIFLCMLSTNKGMLCPKGAVIGLASPQKSSWEIVFIHIRHPVDAGKYVMVRGGGEEVEDL